MQLGDRLLRFALPRADAERAEEALRAAGFDVGVEEWSEPTTMVTAGWTPHGDDEDAMREKAQETLNEARIAARLVATGVLVRGGTPEHGWVDVVLDGERTGLTILAASDAEADEQLDAIAEEMGVERDRLNISPPPGWAGYGVPGA